MSLSIKLPVISPFKQSGLSLALGGCGGSKEPIFQDSCSQDSCQLIKSLLRLEHPKALFENLLKAEATLSSSSTCGMTTFDRIKYHIHLSKHAAHSAFDPKSIDIGHHIADATSLKESLKSVYDEALIEKIEKEAFSVFSSLNKSAPMADDALLARYKPLITPELRAQDPAEAASSVRQVASQISDLLRDHDPLIWLTGTNSYTLVAMHNARALGVYPDLRLVPTGELLSYNLVPLAGELGAGIEKKGINISHLSGVMPGAFKGAIYYATEKEFMFDPLKAKESIFSELRSIFELQREKPENLNRFKIALLRALYFTELSLEQKQHIKHSINEAFSAMDGEVELKEELIKEFETLIDKTSQALLPEAIKRLYSVPSFPLILGSCSIPSDDLRAARGSCITGELVYRGHLSLGRDIQVAITDDAHLELARVAFAETTVKVLSLSQAQFVINLDLEDCELEPIDF